jgi:hypothetical protein
MTKWRSHDHCFFFIGEVYWYNRITQQSQWENPYFELYYEQDVESGEIIGFSLHQLKR